MFCDIGKFKKYVGKKFLIRSQQDMRFALDTCSHQNDGGDVILYEADRENPNQIFTVDCMGHIMNASNPKSVLYAKDTRDEGRVAITGRDEVGADAYDALARWTLTKSGEIICQGNPDQMFNIAGGSASNRASMIMWHRQGPTALNDKWKIDVIGGFQMYTYAPDIGNFKSFLGAVFYIRCQANEMYVVDSASKQRGGGNCLLWSDTFNKNPNQIWIVDKYGHIINAERPGEMMALVPVKCAKGANVAVTKLTKTGLMNCPIASWALNDAGEIVNLGDPSLILNISGGAVKNGPNMILWTRQDKNSKNDKWNIRLV